MSLLFSSSTPSTESNETRYQRNYFLIISIIFCTLIQFINSNTCHAFNNDKYLFHVTVTQPVNCSGIIVRSLSPYGFNQIILTQNPNSNTDKTFFKLSANTNHNIASRGNEVWLFGITDQTGLWSPDKIRQTLRGSWEERTQKDSPLGIVFISTGNAPSFIETDAVGDIDFLVLTHPWSGIITTQFGLNQQTFDLYSPERRMTTIRLTTCNPNLLTTQRTYTFHYPVQTKENFSITNIDSSNLTVNKITTSSTNLTITNTNSEVYVQKIKSTVITIITILITAILSIVVFLSFFSIWNKRFKSRILSSLGLALCIGTMWWLVFFPAIMSTDSLEQWFQATQHVYGTRHPPLMAMLMSVSQLFDTTPATFSLIQSVLFWWSLFTCISMFSSSRWRWILYCTLISLHPVLWSYSVTLWKDIWLTTFILSSVTLQVLYQKTLQKKYLFLCIITTSIAISFRHNAVTFAVLPPLLFYYYAPSFIYSNRIKKILISSFIFILCLIPAKLFEMLPFAHHETGRLAPQLLIQSLGVYVRLDPNNPERIQFKENFDTKFGIGIFDSAMNDYLCEDWKYLIFPHKKEKALLHRDIIVAEKQFVIDAFITAIKNHPLLWLKHRFCNLKMFFAGHHGSITHPGIDLNSFRFESDSFFPTIKNYSLKIIARFNQSIFISHLFYILILLISLLISIFLNFKAVMIVASTALFYIVPYLIIDMTPEWRFLLPTNILAGICLMMLVERKYRA
jgi:hypothetical protein